jgi:hypothetical protein
MILCRKLSGEVNLPAKVMQLLPEMVRREPADRRLLAIRRLPDRMRQHSAQALLLAARATLQDLRLRPVKDSPVPPARARRHSPGPGPCAFFPEIPAARKCNRAARCGGRPICARYRPLNNRRALAGCDNKCSRSQRKHARRARTFPIAALDRYRCLPRRIAD